MRMTLKKREKSEGKEFSLTIATVNASNLLNDLR